MPLSVPLEVARPAFVESVTAFVAAVDGLDEIALLGASRCHGWSRLDLLAHLLSGWQELLGGMVSRTADPTTVDASSYWTTFETTRAGEDPVVLLMGQRRRGSAYGRPDSARAQLRDVAAAVVRGAEGLEGSVSFQGMVLTAGDLLATWAVEDAVHHLDLDVDLAPPAALALARRTLDELAGSPLPASWDDADAVLVGSGRVPPPPGTDALLAARLPLLG